MRAELADQPAAGAPRRVAPESEPLAVSTSARDSPAAIRYAAHDPERLDAQTLQILAARAERYLESPARWHKFDGVRRVAEIDLPLAGGSKRGLFKCIRLVKWLDRWRLAFGLRRSDVRRAFHFGRRMIELGIPTPRPLCCFEATTATETRLYSLTEVIPGVSSLRDLLLDAARQSRGRLEGLAAMALEDLAAILRHLHEARFDHRDLKFENILARQDAEGLSLWLIDLDDVRRWPLMLPRARRVQNISRLNSAATGELSVRLSQRLRFLKSYLPPRANWKWWWRQIAARTCQKLATADHCSQRISQ